MSFSFLKSQVPHHLIQFIPQSEFLSDTTKLEISKIIRRFDNGNLKGMNLLNFSIDMYKRIQRMKHIRFNIEDIDKNSRKLHDSLQDQGRVLIYDEFTTCYKPDNVVIDGNLATIPTVLARPMVQKYGDKTMAKLPKDLRELDRKSVV